MKYLLIAVLLCLLGFGALALQAQQTAHIQVTLTTDGHIVTLTWNASGSGNIAGYNVYRGPGASGPWTLLTPAPINQLTYQDQTVSAGKAYAYYVTAVDTVGVESGPSNIVTCTIPTP